MKYFKNFKLSYFIRTMLVALIYPVFKMFSSERKALALSDSCLILALVLLIMAVFYNLYQKGHFDNHRYLFTAGSKNEKTYKEFIEESEKKREDGFNYPLLCSLMFFVISVISSLFA